MRTIHYYDVVSVVIKNAEKILKKGIRFSEAKLQELETHCRVLEQFSDAFDTGEFSVDFDEKTDEVILSIVGRCFDICGDNQPILDVIGKTVGLTIACRDDQCVELSFRFGII